MASEMMTLLCSTAKLERDKGQHMLRDFLKHNTKVLENEQVEKELINLMSDDENAWEKKHGSLMAAKIILEHQIFSNEFIATVNELILHLLDDKEYRVRISAGEVLGLLCMVKSIAIYEKCKDRILAGIHNNLERKLDEGEKDDRFEEENLTESQPPSPSHLDHHHLQRRGSAEQIFHDTAGWKSLETWMKCLQCVIEGCGHKFHVFVDQDLLDLVFASLMHTNRFVRETGFHVCSALIESSPKENPPVYKHGDQFAEFLGLGLADNWSQVRLASSMATRKFLVTLTSESEREHYYPCLLPRLCLNRYYVAEGVRIYSQETWRQIAGVEGKHLVEKFIDEVVKFYVEETNADNHAVREAACACIAELGVKVERSAVQPYVSQLLNALLVCFNDDSWPVRDAACVACGNFVRCFPEESEGVMKELYPLFFNNLEDNIPSVRQGAALALSHVVEAYGEASYTVVLPKLETGLASIEKQQSCVEKYSNMDKGPATYGVVKQLRDNDMDLHTNQTMYSCGSLAPKMGRGSRGGGCMDHKFQRPAEPWEMADGCVHLLSCLSNQQPLQQKLAELLPLMAAGAGRHHYTQHLSFLESICKQLPNIAKGLGKKTFKAYLELFLDSIFYSMTCESGLTSTAARECLIELSKFLGPSILRGRVEQHNPRYLELLDEIRQPPVIM